MIADYNYYTNIFKGFVVEQSKYEYFAERAGDELARFVKLIPNTEDAQTALKNCSCAITEYLYNDFKSSKNGQKIGSESVNGYYSVSYSTTTQNDRKNAIYGLISQYLGQYIFRRLKVVY